MMSTKEVDCYDSLYKVHASTLQIILV